jgi:SAM-dependent methyltransferase
MSEQDAAFIGQYPLGSKVRMWGYAKWLSLGITKALKRRRIDFMDGLLGSALSRPGKILEVGCGSGRDFVRCMSDSPAQIYGLDPFDAGIKQRNFTFVQGDMISIPFADNDFDAVISIGVMEHIEPFEKLSAGIKEMVRVGKKYCMVVPSIATRIEPHFLEYRWQLKRANSYQLNLNYLSDAAWTKFEGFSEAKIARYDYIPGLVTCLMIYGPAK